ncbi:MULTISPECIES: signal peptidase I [unclassified Bacillus (in: firmicutes)]|uniref:signal peptidase I n=1 Tax=unclassified Bacillus (in: firmicutes) TaxID=185979 RepID=UPI000BF0F658|nr:MULTISPECIES: signal peptidase I [unclassified Bacillus (in: firmicutes)]PEJ60758.1 signal peptidase I [Bacillus sp. AFS002410]PEL09735.1 signal peptidase I [Bacillus sp. AFS017336]
MLRKEVFDWGKAIFIGIAIAFIVRTFLFSTYVVDGESMMPTLKNGNLLVINKFGYELSDIKRFDVIVFHANKQEDYVKRVIGLPGDSIEYKDDQLYINDKKWSEPFLNDYKSTLKGTPFTGDFNLNEITGKAKVPSGYVFVEGDNRPKSYDSRLFGFVKIDKIVGKVDLLYWPLSNLNTNFNK